MTEVVFIEISINFVLLSTDSIRFYNISIHFIWNIRKNDTPKIMSGLWYLTLFDANLIIKDKINAINCKWTNISEILFQLICTNTRNTKTLESYNDTYMHKIK